jgi:tetratricopeptide (TPR) repeat protein
MRQILLRSIILLSFVSASACVYAQKAGDSELHVPAGTILTFHLTEAYESCPKETPVKVKVSTPIDSGVNKTGDAVEGALTAALTCNKQTILPAATHLLGDFVELAARSGSQTSSYAIEFTFVQAKTGNHSIHAEMHSQAAVARNQQGKLPAVQKAASKKDSGPAPLSAVKIATSLAKGESSRLLASEIKQRGIDFYCDEDDVEGFRILGATEEVLSEVRDARFIYVDYDADPSKWKAAYAQAESELRPLEAKHPDSPGAHMWLGMVLQLEGDNGQAILESRKAIALKPDLVYPHRTLAAALYASGKKDDAIAELQECIQLNPNAPGTHIVLGYFLSFTGNPQSALSEAREAVREAPNYFATHLVLGTVLQGQRNGDEAIPEFREALRLNPSSSKTHFELGMALFAKGHYDDAASEFLEASRLQPRSANNHVWLAGVLSRSGHFEESAAEARVALFYDPKVNGAKEVLNAASTKLNDPSANTGASAPQTTQTIQAAPSSGLGGSTWSCHEVQKDAGSGQAFPFSFSITFLETGMVKKDGQPWGTFAGSDATWQLNGSNIAIQTPDHAGYAVYQGSTDISSSITARTVSLYHQSGDFGSLNCTRQSPPAPRQTTVATNQSPSASSNHPPYDDKCIRLGPGNLGAVTFTNVCTEPVDLKWCYRKHGSSDPWTCTVTLKLLENHTLSSPFCYQCSFDGRTAAYLSSRNLSSMLPSDQEVASWSDSGASQSGSANSANSSAPNDGQRRWRIANPSQNWDTVYLEVRGRSGDSTSDDWNDETPITNFSLQPGAQQLLTCGGWFSLDIKWYTSSSSNPQTDIYYASLICYANNFVWNNNHNLREYDFPRQ